jgi:primosomal protein N' (replication factor Y) (superfamily II helicase)
VADRFVSVAVPVPALDLLTYRVPDTLTAPAPGARVVVPLGKRTLTGVALGDAAPLDNSVAVKDILQILDAQEFLPADVRQLTEWVSEYYLAGPGAALAAAMPPHALTARVDAFRTVRLVSLTAEGHDIAERLAIGPSCAPDDSLPSLGTRQREVLVALKGSPHGIEANALAERAISSAVISRLKALGLVTIRRDRRERDPFVAGTAALAAPDIAPTNRTLTAEQQRALQHLRALAATRQFRVALLHGVTGSGKTEVYLQLADEIRKQGRGVLMLVPEIALTPAVAAAFRARFGSRVAIQHSGLSDGERHDQWHRIRRGDVDVVIGTRSAIFVPLARPGLIVVDEEHDTSYKQEDTPRYHGRDVAVMRGKFADALVVLGSATPAMESYYNAEHGRYTPLTLTRRVFDRAMANVRVIDMREEMAADGPDVVISRALREAMQARFDKREQVLALLNRRGYAVAVFCRQCGVTIDCPNCSVSLTVHSAGKNWRARCHYCNYARLVPKTCSNCAAPYLERIGFGTERVESEIAALFPQARVGRVDRDTVRRRGSLTETLNRFARRELDVLVGTQMIAKGHDFPQVTLVGVISADVGLGLADFRAAERTFQLLTQVAGRAGRGEQVGEALIQTLFPNHYSIRLACAQDYPAFYARELEYRKGMRYPPVVAMINVVVRGRTFDAAMQAAADLASRTSANSTPARGRFVVLGPAPAPLTKLRGEHRAQFFLKGTSRAAMRHAIRAALKELPEVARRASVDVDPLAVL